MARYRVENTIVNTDNAVKSWEEATRWNGSNHISKATGTQWDHEKLYKSRKGRYYVEHTSQWQGSTPRAEWLSPEAATVGCYRMIMSYPRTLSGARTKLASRRVTMVLVHEALIRSILRILALRLDFPIYGVTEAVAGGGGIRYAGRKM